MKQDTKKSIALFALVLLMLSVIVLLGGCATPCATRFSSAEKIANQPPECLKPVQADLGAVGIAIVN